MTRVIMMGRRDGLRGRVAGCGSVLNGVPRETWDQKITVSLIRDQFDPSQHDPVSEFSEKFQVPFSQDSLGLNSVSARLLSARSLTLAESSATVLSSNDYPLTRVSHYGDFLSRRLNVTLQRGDLAHVACAETDLTRLLAVIFDPATPKRVTDAAR